MVSISLFSSWRLHCFSYHGLYHPSDVFTTVALDPDVIDEVKEKIKTLSLPKSFSYRLVLVNSVDEEIIASKFFAKIINFGDLITV